MRDGKRNKSLSAMEVTPPCCALYKLKNLTLQKKTHGDKKEKNLSLRWDCIACQLVFVLLLSFPHNAHIVQLLTALNERDRPLTGWILVMQADGI